ncbi:hypothetical protein SAMN02982929_07170 [Saccharopolyspora kobensis]|uniref:Uncharacterized protein n=1 Tax=Saccharopolyspora kobensis TaxID=146035 RepID=A0A1H6EPB9_9PSEU|nr:hypothetical protein [Saccharopolyspora kobensis]SEG98649.1 hypothetical protein SAMN02982929_07170 [Saccharopolyspora kobensis]SFD24171.1 hypothetical protein SAMN05216506_103199 [Saccharopolyspora kobensis]
MTKQPITRYYNFGVTFRWIRGDAHIAVKRGYVCEGQAFVVLWQPPYEIRDRPGDDPRNDKRTWIATIPVNPIRWDDDRYFVNTACAWALKNPRFVDLKNRTDT